MAKRTQRRFGIGEWYGRSFLGLTQAERKQYAAIGDNDPKPICPFLSTTSRSVPCWKSGGVCSLRRYQRTPDGQVSADVGSTLRATCPSRFEQDKSVYGWISERILATSDAVPIGQINFLEKVPLEGAAPEEEPSKKEVGRIDNVLAVPDSTPLVWCPVEIQAVYFSGDAMENDFGAIMKHDDSSIPFPAGNRRPDYRSSGPKRLMPQLQIKVPTLRRWGKKMAVVIDQDFFKNMGRMEVVSDVSNCDVAWFVVRYNEASGTPVLELASVRLTTLEASVLGLVAGRPVTLARFEERIVEKLERLGSAPIEIPADE